MGRGRRVVVGRVSRAEREDAAARCVPMTSSVEGGWWIGEKSRCAWRGLREMSTGMFVKRYVDPASCC